MNKYLQIWNACTKQIHSTTLNTLEEFSFLIHLIFYKIFIFQYIYEWFHLHKGVFVTQYNDTLNKLNSKNKYLILSQSLFFFWVTHCNCIKVVMKISHLIPTKCYKIRHLQFKACSLRLSIEVFISDYLDQSVEYLMKTFYEINSSMTAIINLKMFIFHKANPYKPLLLLIAYIL